MAVCNRIFDSHAHYFDARFDREAEGGANAILHTVFGGTVEKIINVGTNPQNSSAAVEQAAHYRGMYAAVGIHPEDCHFLDEETSLAELRVLLGDVENRKRKKIVAIGEIGLDYHTGFFGDVPLDNAKELRVFEAQLRMAQEMDLPVIIHDRDAHGDIFETILRYPGVRGVMHSFSGSPELACEYARRGWYLSFSGTVTFQNAARVREAAKAVPRERLLVETDCPYLAPHPFRGKLNHSGYLEYTISAIATLWNATPQQVADQTRINAERLFCC